MRKNTKLVFIESPGNPTLAISDIRAISDIAHNQGAIMGVDNTFMSPVLQQPFALGADVIMHSMTKFLNGHADVVAGIVIAKDEDTYILLRKTLNQIGGVINPFDAFLVHRGLKTLAIRMKTHCTNAMKIAEYLSLHRLIQNVMYPGLKNHPQYETGLKQHMGHGGMISFELKGGYEAGKKLMNSVKLCTLAVSLGGVETLIQHPASMTHYTMGEAGRKAAEISEGMVRLSVGIENADELIEDLEQALDATR
jgi:methionine-gamma-lyase